MESSPLKDQILLGHGRDDNSIQFDSLPNESGADEGIDQTVSSGRGQLPVEGSAQPIREDSIEDEIIATETSGQSGRQRGSVSSRQGLSKGTNARGAEGKDLHDEGKRAIAMSEAQQEVIQLTEEYYNGDFEDLDIEEDDEELVYDDDNFEEVSEAAAQSGPKQRINIDKEETIPDIRKSKRTDVASPRKSPQSASQQHTQSPAGTSGRAKPELRNQYNMNPSRSFSGQSRTRPDDKIPKRSSPSKSSRVLADMSQNPRELQSHKGSDGSPPPVDKVGVHSFYGPERPLIQSSLSRVGSSQIIIQGPSEIREQRVYDITNQVLSAPLDPADDIYAVQAASSVEIEPPQHTTEQDQSNEMTQQQIEPVSQAPSTTAQRQPRKLTSRSKPKASQGVQQLPAKLVQTHRTGIAPRQLNPAARSPKTQSIVKLQKRPSAVASPSPTSKAQHITSPKRSSSRSSANRAGGPAQQMIEQMKKMRLNRTTLLNTSHNQKPSSALALPNDNKKVQNSNINKNFGSQQPENLIYHVNKNKLRMKQNSDGEVVKFAKPTAKQTRQLQSDTRKAEHGASTTEHSTSDVVVVGYQKGEKLGHKRKRARGSSGLLNQTTQNLHTDGERDVSEVDNIINVHQHFNQPSIMNFNHNEYFERQIQLQSPGLLKNLADKEEDLVAARKLSQQNVRSVPLTNAQYGRVKHKKQQQQIERGHQHQRNSKRYQTQLQQQQLGHEAMLLEPVNAGHGSNPGTPERRQQENGLNQYTAPFNQSPFNQGLTHGASAVSRSREMLVQSAANGELRLLAKNIDRSQRGLSNLLRPQARAASSRSPNRGTALHLQSQTGIHMKPQGPETSVGRRKGIIRHLKSANPARYHLLSQRTKGLASMLSKVNNKDQLQNVMFSDSQLNLRKSQSRSQKRMLMASHLSSQYLSEKLLAASPDGVQLTTHQEEMSTIFSKQAAALSAQNDPSQMYHSKPNIAVLSEPSDSDLHAGYGMARNILAQTSQEAGQRRTSTSAKRTSPKVSLLQSPGSAVKPERRRISSRSRYERMLKTNYHTPVMNPWMSQSGSYKNDGFYQKEDIEDQLNFKKTELNKFVAENTKLRTRNAMFQDQMKDKDKLIDELLQTTSVLGARVEQLAGNQSAAHIGSCASVGSARDGLVSENSGGQPALPSNICKALQQQQQSQKSQLNLLRLKKQVHGMKAIISNKNQELQDLQRNIKSTKIYELQEELQIYRRECMKLRKISENAFQLVIKNGLEPKLQSTQQTSQLQYQMNQQHLPLQSSEQQDAESIFDHKGAVHQNVATTTHHTPQASMAQNMKEGVYIKTQFGTNQNNTSVNTSPAPAYGAEHLNEQMVMTCNGLQRQLQERADECNQAKKQVETAIEQAKEADARRREDQKVIAELQAQLDAKPPSQETDRNQDQLVNKLRQQVSVMQAKIQQIQTQKQEEVAQTPDQTELHRRIEQLQEDNERRKLHEIEATEQKLKLAGDFERTQKEFINQNAEYINLQKSVKEIQSDCHQKQLQLHDLDHVIRKLQESLTQAEARNRELRESLSRSQVDAANSGDALLFVDIKEIEEQLQNIRIEAVDERSGALSEVKSSLLKTLSTLGGSRMSRLQSRQAGTSPRNRRQTEKTKPRSQVALVPSGAAQEIPADGGVAGLARAATLGEAKAQQIVEIIQERVEEEEPELGLLAHLAAEPTGASLGSEHEDRETLQDLDSLPRQLNIAKHMTEPLAAAGANQYNSNGGPEANSDINTQFKIDAIKIQDHLAFQGENEEVSITKEDHESSQHAPEPSQQEQGRTEGSEASSHLLVIGDGQVQDRILAEPSPGTTPATPVLGGLASAQYNSSLASQRIFEQVHQTTHNTAPSVESSSGKVSRPANYDSQPNIKSSSGENTAKVVPLAAVGTQFQFQYNIQQAMRNNDDDAVLPPRDLESSSASKQDGPNGQIQIEEGGENMLIVEKNTITPELTPQLSARQDEIAQQTFQSNLTESTNKIQVNQIVLTSTGAIKGSSRTYRSNVEQEEQLSHLDLQSAVKDTQQSLIIQLAGHEVQQDQEMEKAQSQRQDQSNNSSHSAEAKIQQNPQPAEKIDTEVNAVNLTEFSEQKGSISSESNPAGDRGMLLCAKKGLQKVVPMFSNAMFSKLSSQGSGAEDFESNGLSVLQSSKAASLKSRKEVKQSSRLSIHQDKMVSLSINSNSYRMDGDSLKIRPKSSKHSSSHQQDPANRVKKVEPSTVPGGSSPLQSAQEQLLDEIPSNECITDTEQTISPNNNTRSLKSKISNEKSNKQRLELSISSSKIFASASGTSGKPRATPHFVGPERSKPVLNKVSLTDLRAVLQTTINRKIDEELRQAMNPGAVSKIVESVAEIFQQVAAAMKLNRMSVREAFAPQLYSTRRRGSLSPRRTEKPQEIEVLKAEAFVHCIETQMGQNQFLDFNQKQCFFAIFQCPELSGLVIFNEVCDAFATLTIPDGKPQDTEAFSFSILNLKQIRILNRLNAYLSQTQMNLEDFTSDLSRSMKTKIHNNKIEVISSDLLFERFQQAGITKSSQVDQILADFLGIEGQKHIIHINKISKCLKELARHHYFTSIGLQKNKLDLIAYENERENSRSLSSAEQMGSSIKEESDGSRGTDRSEEYKH